MFTENADLNENNSLKDGIFRFFIKQTDYSIATGMQSTLFIKAPMQGNNFQMDDKAIKGGSVIYKLVCPTCFTINYEPIGGYVKGINITPEKPANQTKWFGCVF